MHRIIAYHKVQTIITNPPPQDLHGDLRHLQRSSRRLPMHTTILLMHCLKKEVTQESHLHHVLEGGMPAYYFLEPNLITRAQYHSYGVVASPSDALALTNCLIVHPSDFAPGTHVLVNRSFALTVRYVATHKTMRGLNIYPATTTQGSCSQVLSVHLPCNASGLDYR